MLTLFDTSTKFVMVTELLGTPYTPLIYKSSSISFLSNKCAALVKEVDSALLHTVMCYPLQKAFSSSNTIEWNAAKDVTHMSN